MRVKKETAPLCDGKLRDWKLTIVEAEFLKRRLFVCPLQTHQDYALGVI